MGKNHKHKKVLKSERAKIKLKHTKTKFLPKGQNVTDLSFKIKPIVLPEQLKAKGDEVVSSRKLNLKEILNRLAHHNTTVKYDNCQQLKELICSENGALKRNLAKILKGVGPLMLDIEHKVRKESVKLLAQILYLSTQSDITSFFDMLSSYLRCAMTHINPNVQEDSLTFLDVLLSRTPDLVARNSHKILDNFFTLISKQKNDSKHCRTLSENLQSKHTGVRWRVSVLLRLKRIFEVMYELVSKGVKGTQDRAIMVIDITETNFAPIYVDKYVVMEGMRNKPSIEAQYVENYINTLVPLLQGTWLEVAPSNMTTTNSGKFNSTIIKDDTASTLNCVLEVFYFLYKLGESVTSENKIKSRFHFKNPTYLSLLNVLLVSFPYIGALEKKHETFGVNNDVRCIKENLLICYLFCVQYNHLKTKAVVASAQEVLEYLNHCFTTFNKNKEYTKNEKLNKLFLSIVEVILTTNLSSWKHNGLEIEEFVENTVDYYFKIVDYCDVHMELLALMHDVMNSKSEKQILLADKCSNFLLEDTLSNKMLDFLLLMVKKGAVRVQEQLRQKLPQILDNIFEVTVTGIDVELMKIVRILNLFHYVPLSDEDKDILRRLSEEYPPCSSTISPIIG